MSFLPSSPWVPSLRLPGDALVRPGAPLTGQVRENTVRTPAEQRARRARRRTVRAARRANRGRR